MVSLEKMVRLATEGRFDAADKSPNPGTPGDIDLRKVRALGAGTKYDVCGSSASTREVEDGAGRIGDVLIAGLCHAFAPDGRCVSLFKTLYTNSCRHQCRYCPNSSAGRGGAPVFAYTPEELARITVNLYRGNYIEGLFLSSGVGGDEDTVMEQMLESVKLLRTKYRFMGYVHLKILPGASREHVKQALELVDRVSINVESPSRSRMSELSGTKDYENDIIQRQRYVRDILDKSRANAAAPAGQTTQFVIGAAGESDEEIFDRMVYEYGELSVKRAYFSSFSAVGGTPLEGRCSQPRWREHRLYQMDWLYREYGLEASEIRHAFDENGFIGNSDPKARIARATLSAPVDPNIAGYRELVRVPGIGPRSAYRIVNVRRSEKLWKGRQLAKLGVRMRNAAPFLRLNGWATGTLDRWLQ